MEDIPGELDLAPLKQLVKFRPAQVRSRAGKLRQRSVECADLAVSCVTLDARRVLSTIAQDLEREADELEATLRLIRRLYSERSEDEPSMRCDA